MMLYNLCYYISEGRTQHNLNICVSFRGVGHIDVDTFVAAAGDDDVFNKIAMLMLLLCSL